MSSIRIVEKLKQMSPDFKRTGLADTLAEAFDAINELSASVKGITAQLDLDAGVTDADYAANNDPTFADIDADANLAKA